jgi:hypothetical protein
VRKKIFSALEEFFKKSSKFIPFNRFCAKKRQKALLFPEKINTFASRIKKRGRECIKHAEIRQTPVNIWHSNTFAKL